VLRLQPFVSSLHLERLLFPFFSPPRVCLPTTRLPTSAHSFFRRFCPRPSRTKNPCPCPPAAFPSSPRDLPTPDSSLRSAPSVLFSPNSPLPPSAFPCFSCGPFSCFFHRSHLDLSTMSVCLEGFFMSIAPQLRPIRALYPISLPSRFDPPTGPSIINQMVPPSPPLWKPQVYKNPFCLAIVPFF